MTKTIHPKALLLLVLLSAACGEDPYSADDYDPEEGDPSLGVWDATVQGGGPDAGTGWNTGNNDAGGSPWGSQFEDAGTTDAGSWDASQSGDGGAAGGWGGGPWDAATADAASPDAGSADASTGAGGNACDTLTYESFGRQFLTSYCVGCHGAVNPRNGVRLDSLAGVVARKAGVKSAVLGGAMPQGNNRPSSAERERLGQWIDCGPR